MIDKFDVPEFEFPKNSTDICFDLLPRDIATEIELAAIMANVGCSKIAAEHRTKAGYGWMDE